MKVEGSERRRIEAPRIEAQGGAEGVGFGERVYLSPTGGVWGKGCAPPIIFFLNFLSRYAAI